jgi:hypothetical protein
MAFTNLEKTDMVLINGEARGHSDIQASTPNLRFPQRIFPLIVRFSWQAFLATSLMFHFDFSHNDSLFTLLFKPLLFSD